MIRILARWHYFDASLYVMEAEMRRKWTAQEVKEWYLATGAVTYYNREDANIIVRKNRSTGWTVNWANPKAYFLQGGILAVVFIILYLIG